MLFNALRGGISLTDVILYVISSLIVIFITMPIHEFSHGFIATKLGDPTPKYQGRLTLNPFAHIDYLGALSILVFGFGWARPVQVNMRNFKNEKAGMALTALAGPVSNIIVATIAVFLNKLIFYVFANIVGDTLFSIVNFIELILYWIAQINVGLAVFNFIPIPPLDGSKIIAVILPDRIYYKLLRYERYLIWAVFVLIYLGVLDTPLYYSRNLIMSGINYITALPFNIF